MTPTMLSVLKQLRLFWERNGYGPAHRDLSKLTGIKSVGNISRIIGQLEEGGYISRRKNRRRSVQVIDRKMSSSVHS